MRFILLFLASLCVSACSYDDVGMTVSLLVFSSGLGDDPDPAYAPESEPASAGACYGAQGRRDATYAAQYLWASGDCAYGSAKHRCEASRTLRNDLQSACFAYDSYVGGAQSAFEIARDEAIQDAELRQAELRAVSRPSSLQLQEIERIDMYLNWARNCRLRGVRIDC